tara:strand:- start:190 stop:399 length:210 start_codon:yes stop_codon:yes gene_type:complete
MGAVVEESDLGLVQPCKLLETIENKEIFNLYYDTEILAVYANENMFETFKSTIESQCNLTKFSSNQPTN